ncbi:MAG: protein kinase [Acidobacteriota bacterium]
MIDTSLKHYRIVEKIGEGGMGIVYRALDTHLDRTVAIKVLRPEAVGDAERKWRFVREAKAASALNHPHIVTIHDIDSDGGVDFLVMEYLEGTPLDQLIPRGGGLPVSQVIDIARQIASALGAAHSAGIVHRDVKPGNVMVGKNGRVKVLDFGLAKLVETSPAGDGVTSDSTATAGSAYLRTRQGVILGTIAYMSPEQAQGNPVDARSDVFSLGCVLYEMLTGQRPFQGDSHLLTLTAILRDDPPSVKTVRPDVPAALQSVLTRSLAKAPADRYPTANEMEAALGDLAPAPPLFSATVASAGPGTGIRRRALFWPAVLVLVAAAGAGAWFFIRQSRIRRARSEGLPEIGRLVERGRPAGAFLLARQVEAYAPNEVVTLRRDSWPAESIRTDPPGAEVLIQDYLGGDTTWHPVGRSPIENVRLPVSYFRWKIEKPGYESVELAAHVPSSPVRLDRIGTVPSGMVRVPGGSFTLRSLSPVALDDYWIDRYEVTNRQYKAFVVAGGYTKRDFWKQPFVRAGRQVPWDEAAAEFRDATGRPGPASWELGSFLEGREDYPVEGVSWYEAAAYAEFAGKSLPTVYHWYHAAGLGNFSQILLLSNFNGKSAATAGTHKGLSPFGTYDMAGNVKEWCWNETSGRRYLLGGSWSDVSYMFMEADAQDAFRRLPGYGFRCVRYTAPLPETLAAPIAAVSRDYNKETPVSDDVFRLYRSFYSYDKTPLEPRSEKSEGSTADESPYWRREKVSFTAAYGNERVPAFLFIPKNARPPYQTVLYFPSSLAVNTHSSADLNMRNLDFVIRSGRAVFFPVYKGTYERQVKDARLGSNQWRDLVIQQSKDVRRAVDYLETRPDLDISHLTFYGVSLGAIDGITFVALEDRVKAAIFSAGGFRMDRVPPEVEPLNFTPRIHVPVLLITGRFDFSAPYETAQVPMFRLLGTPEKEKRHLVHDGGHIPTEMQPIIKEILDWLDKYQGPVAQPG